MRRPDPRPLRRPLTRAGGRGGTRRGLLPQGRIQGHLLPARRPGRIRPDGRRRPAARRGRHLDHRAHLLPAPRSAHGDLPRHERRGPPAAVDQHLPGPRRAGAAAPRPRRAADRHPLPAPGHRRAPGRRRRHRHRRHPLRSLRRARLPPDRRGRPPQHHPAPARRRLPRRFLRRPVPHLRHPRRPPVPQRAPVLLRPRVEPRPPGPGPPVPRLHLAHRLAGPRQLRHRRGTRQRGVGHAHPQDRRRPALRDRVVVGVPVPRALCGVVPRGPGVPRRRRRPPVRSLRRARAEQRRARRREPRLEAGLRPRRRPRGR
ncbi:hypothetical protein NOGI109294_14770 [Nocardiopsis gilva]